MGQAIVCGCLMAAYEDGRIIAFDPAPPVMQQELVPPSPAGVGFTASAGRVGRIMYLLQNDGNIAQFDVCTEELTIIPTTGDAIQESQAMVFDPNTETLTIAPNTLTNAQIQSIDLQTGIVSTIAISDTGIDRPLSAVYNEDFTKIIVSDGSDSLYEFDRNFQNPNVLVNTFFSHHNAMDWYQLGICNGTSNDLQFDQLLVASNIGPDTCSLIVNVEAMTDELSSFCPDDPALRSYKGTLHYPYACADISSQDFCSEPTPDDGRPAKRQKECVDANVYLKKEW